MKIGNKRRIMKRILTVIILCTLFFTGCTEEETTSTNAYLASQQYVRTELNNHKHIRFWEEKNAFLIKCKNENFNIDGDLSKEFKSGKYWSITSGYYLTTLGHTKEVSYQIKLIYLGKTEEGNENWDVVSFRMF